MKRGADFHFKQFTIKQRHSAHKVGTDGVLLGAWINTRNAQRILDIGTGTGLIALMLAQRTSGNVIIDAVEIEAEDAAQAVDNITNSCWSARIQVHHTSIQNFGPALKYDLIVSNPPFFISSLRPSEKRRSQARHTHSLSFTELLMNTKRLLNKGGCLGIVLPCPEAERFIQEAHFHQLYPYRQLELRSRKEKPIERLLIELGEKPQPVITEYLILHGEGNDWSQAYQHLTREFYWKM